MIDWRAVEKIDGLTVGWSRSGVQAVQVVGLAENAAFVQGEFLAGAELASTSVACETR